MRLVSVGEADPERTREAADARYAPITEPEPCDRGYKWVQLCDADDTGTGWWHHGEEGDENGFYVKCRVGNRALRFR